MPNNTIKTLILTTVLTSLIGCAGNSPQTNGALMGAGLGALAGQAIGGDTDATLIGAGVGALAGTVMGGQQEWEGRGSNREARRQHGQTTRSSTTRRVLNPDGTYTTEGTETTESTETTDGYQGLP
tara:strand:- start:539 stop:916 length:378 start_codon:yes stop_codon:yes gene_type:complete